MPSMLDRIVAATRRRLPGLLEQEKGLRARAGSADPVRDFATAVTAGGLQVIAEIKRRSPSAGLLAPGLDAADLAARYEAGGAAALSVLTEPEFFGGSLRDLATARQTVGIPLLRKDFILDPIQVWEARAAGADAVLLIVAVLDDRTLEECIATAATTGMAALVEAHTVGEAERAIGAGAAIVGINNRDLATFRTDHGVAERLAGAIAEVPVRIAESGVDRPETAARMAAAGYHAVLVGEALVRSADPGAAIGALRAMP
jgi:indole-3-glycerol phosphate synthase